jgi:phage terminase large subunit-like protein
VNKWIRNKSDEEAVQEGYFFDESQGDYLCNFFETFIQIPDGRFAGDKCKLLDWQRDFLMRLNGWRRPDGTRRYRKCFLAVPKKNSKSFLCSGLATFFGLADGEQSPEVIIGAGAREQAEIVYKSARKMIRSSAALSKQVRVVDSRKRIDLPKVDGVIRVISSDAGRQEGINSNFQVLDEIHSHKNRDLFDCLLYAGEARKQPLFITITTAGSNKGHFAFEEWTYAQKVIDGHLTDLELLPIIYSIGDGDVDDMDTWRKANPSLGTILSEEDFKQKMKSAKESPIKWSAWLRYRGNKWVDSEKAWLNMDKWEGCTRGLLPESLHGKTCYGGLDLSHKQDLTAFVLYFPEEKAFLCWAWTTKYQVEMRNQKNKASYLRFIEDGHLIKLDGEVINQDFMLHKICELAKQYKIQTIGYDPWNSQQLALNLEDEGLDMASFRQGYGSLSEPTKLFEEMVLEQSIEHFNNPLLRWTASNCMVTQDPAGNIKPDKDKSHEMIDPILCCIMALGLANISRPTGPSIYETRGVLRF